MNKALRKDAFGEIWRSKQRFLSILAIVAIGIGFFAGVKSTSPNMKDTADRYFNSAGLMDVKVQSAIGLTEDDVKAVAGLEDIESAAGSYTIDLMVTMNGNTSVAHVFSDISDGGDGFNVPTVVEGRMPQSPDECVVEATRYDDTTVAIGDEIVFSTGDKDVLLSERLHNDTFTVVGFVTSPQYISYNKEKTELGDGTIDLFIILPEEAFALDVYTEIYARVENSEELYSFSPEYEQKVEDVMGELEELGETQTLPRMDEVYDAALEIWAEGEDRYLEKEAEFEEKIADARAELDAARAELDAGWEEYRTNYYLWEDARDLGNEQLSDARTKLLLAEATIEETNQFLPVLKELRDTAQSDADMVEAINKEIAELEAELASTSPMDPSYSVIRSEIDMLENLRDNYSSNSEMVVYLTIIIDTLEETITETEAELTAGRAEYEKQRELFRSEIRAAQRELEKAEKQLEDGEKDYEEGLKLLEEQEAEGRTQLDAAYDELQAAKDEIYEMDPPAWYIFDRSVNPGYSDFESNADIVDAIAQVLPVFFILIAMLVCLSGMTRMVEEQRTAMGTLKALGYSNGAISFKFLFYAGSASLIGSIIGLVIGFQLFPHAIYSAYSILYILPPLEAPFHWGLAAVSTAVAVAAVLLTTYISIKAALSTCPAQLMRPKAPKSGKKILLEKIPAIWSRLSFNNKVTMRNLFRYKRRMFMTVVGIAGCTALMLAGFALRDSVGSIVPKQFGEICKYNLVVATSNLEADDDDHPLLEYLDGNDFVDDYMIAQTLTAEAIKEDMTLDVNIFVPAQPSNIAPFIRLGSRTSDDEYTITDDGGIISEKMAEKYDIEPGDTITVKLDSFTQLNIEVTAVCENYAHNYIYISPTYLQENLDKVFRPNTVYVNLTEEGLLSEDSVSLSLFKRDDVLMVTSIAASRDTLSDAMGGLDLIIWVLLASAGALAFVVLYNLTTINLTERTREIATVKVLGFYPKESYNYVFSENLLLSILGGGVGLILGVFLTQFVLKTAEVANFMFARQIRPLSFILAFVLTLVFSTVVNLVLRRKVKNINMVESLKSIE